MAGGHQYTAIYTSIPQHVKFSINYVTMSPVFFLNSLLVNDKSTNIVTK